MTSPPTPNVLSRRRLTTLFAAPVVLLAGAWGAAATVHGRISAPPEAPPPETATADGALVFARHCAYCHGERGDGHGLAYLDPAARHFGKDKFKFVSTANGNPTDDDLGRLIRRGIPGSAMPAFDKLTDAEVAAVVTHVRLLARQGLYAELKRKALDDPEGDFDPPKTARRVAEQLQPGQPIAVPALAPPTPESIARGRAIFLGKEAACASCHGEQGRGDGPQGVARMEALREKEKKGQPLAADEKELLQQSKGGGLVFPRNLTSGVFKGGRDPEHIYARITLGIPGVISMPAVKLPPQDVTDLVNYVLSLSPTPPENGAIASVGQ